MDTLREYVISIFPDLEENTYTLQRKIKLLKSKKDDADEMLQNAACHSGKKRKREVEDWRNNVENIIKEFETLEQRVQQNRRVYDLFKRQELAELLERMTKEVTELVDQSDFPSGLSLEVDESIDQLLLIPEPHGQAFQRDLDNIWTSLMDDSVISIGICGMGGVGKTTLAKCVHDKLLKESTFSGHVYWVTVSQEFSIDKLQSDIAEALNLHFSCGSDKTKRAAQLFQAFKKRGRFVLILDDVWKRIDAEKIGIPSKRDGYKLVVTCRSEEVCRGMDCQKIIKVNTLSKQEALDLFWKTLDRDELSVEVKKICEKMVDRCGGLPLALITLAGSVKSLTGIHEWRDALIDLEESCLGREDMENDVLPILLYSYHRLRDPELKSCFLYCSLYPEDYPFEREELIGYFISEGLMERRLRMQELDRGRAILDQLVRACLLESNSDSDGYLKMHDLIRDMAIRITKDNQRYMVKAGLHLEELPEEQEWTEALDKVSLMFNKIKKISPDTSPNCPSLSTLILSKNPLEWIPDCFFTHMCGLRTLNLSGTHIESLPNSISDLEKLNALLLRDCYCLVSVPSLEKLKLLKHLDLEGTIIEEVPQGMESLTNLKSLYLVSTRLKMIRMGTFQRLTHLQRLLLPFDLDSPIEYVESLKQLEVFRGTLKSVRDLNQFIKSGQIDKQFFSYDIQIRSQKILYRLDEDEDDFLQVKRIHFGEDSLLESSSDTYKNMMPRNIECLDFSKSGLSGCLLDEFPSLNYARDLKECSIGEEDKIECIMRLEEEQQPSTGVPFQSLKTMAMSDLPNLIGLFKWEAVAPLPPGTFSCLTHLSIVNCGKIKKLFPQSSVHNFHNLQILTVMNCVQMEEIIEDDNNEGADITLPMLELLTLANLPQVESICKGKMICDSINSIWLGDIENVKKFPLNLPLLHGQLSPPPSLKSIIVGQKWWESLEWDHHNAKNVLQPLVKLSWRERNRE